MFEQLYVCVRTSEEDGQEVVVVVVKENGQRVPLIAKDQTELEKLLPIAQQLADRTGKEIRLLAFKHGEVQQVLNPRQ